MAFGFQGSMSAAVLSPKNRLCSAGTGCHVLHEQFSGVMPQMEPNVATQCAHEHSNLCGFNCLITQNLPLNLGIGQRTHLERNGNVKL